jgi:hypothetical protein
MQRRSRGSLASRTCAALAVTVLTLLALPSCIFYISTAPTTLSGANIIFVAVDDDGTFVSSVGVTVVAIGSDWHEHGLTAGDGSFNCSVRSGVTRVRIDAEPPRGFVLAEARGWPRELDVSAGGSLRVEVRVKMEGRR